MQYTAVHWPTDTKAATRLKIDAKERLRLLVVDARLESNGNDSNSGSLLLITHMQSPAFA